MNRRREIMGVAGESRVNSDVRGRDSRGDTLIEVLLALMVLSLTAVALILAFSTSIAGSADHRRLATANIVLASASQQAIAQIQANSTLFTCPATTTTFVNNVSFLAAATGNSYLQGTNYGGFTPTISSVLYWNGTSFQGTCILDTSEEVTVTVQGNGLGAITNQFVVNLPSGNLGSASNTSNTIASQLVFASNQTESASGEPGVAFSPQPVVSVLDATNQLDATDLSPIVLSLDTSLSPSGGSISGCSADDPSGQATFSGCVINGPAGTYVVQASVLGQSLDSDPFGNRQDRNLVNGVGSFWQTSPNWYTTTFSVSVSGTPDQVTFAPAPVAQASGSLLTTQPVIDIINPSTGLPDTTKNGTVTLTLSGGQMVGCTNAAANVVTSLNDEVITATAVNGVVTLTGCTFAGAIFYNAVAYPPGKDPTTYTIAASYPNAVTAASTIAVTGPGTAAQLEFVTQPGGVASSSQTAALSPQPQVQIEDAFGNPEYNLTSAPMNLAFASGGTVAETMSSYTQAIGLNTGIVTFAGVAGSAYGGNLRLTATYSGLSITSSAFSISPLGGETMVFSTQPVAGQSGASLTTQPVITIYDSNHNLDTGLTTTLSLTSSGGLLADCTGLTANAGVVDVSTCLFSGTEGSPYTLTASFTDSLSQVISVTSNAISPTGAGAPTRILFITPAGQPVGGTVAGSLLATQPSVQIVDSWGNVVTSSSATVFLTSPVGTTLSGCANLTAVVGVVNVTGCTFGGTVNTFYTMTASSAGLTSATSSPFKVTQAGTAASVTIGPAPSSVSASTLTDSTLTIQLVDAWQNPTTSTSATNLTLSSSSTLGFFASALNLTGALHGTAAVSIPSGIGGSTSEYYGDEKAGTPTISAVLTATQAAYGSGTLTVNAKTTLDTASVVQGNSQVATVNTAFATALEVQVIDQFGNPVPNVAVTFTAPSSGASGAFASGCTSLLNSYTCVATTTTNGDATAANFIASTTAGSFSVVASDTNVATPVTFSLQNSAAAPSKIAITAQPATSITAGNSASISVSVEDTFGNVATSSDPISVVLSSSNFVGGTTLVPAGGGVANFTNLPITAAGSYTITATDNNHTLWTATTNSFTVIAAAPSKIAITAQPATSITAGNSASISVSVEDTFGNVATSSDPISVVLSSSNFVGGTTLVPAGGGVANFTNLPITAAGSYTITATDNNHTLWTATTNSFTVTFAAPSKVIWTIEPTPTTSIAGSPVVGPPTVEVEDTYNNPVKSATVNMAVTTGPPLAVVVSGGSVTTGTNGIATFSSLVLGVAGNYTITASVAGGAPSSVPSNSFAVTAGAATAVMVWGGNGQSAAISTNFSSPLSAFVVDAEGNPVSGATVTFTAPPSGVGGAFAAGCATNLNSYTCGVTTNSSGIAKSSTLTANTLVGPFSVTATITGGVSTPFSETNTTGTFVILTSPQTFATSSTGPGATSGSVIIQAQDGNHNPVVQTSALPVALAYATTGVTLTTDPSTVTIPVGASSVAFTIVSNTSSAGGTFTITATGAYVTATQTETVLQNASATGNAFTAIAAQTVSPTSQPATFPVTMTNNNGATTYYKVSSVDGLITGESASPSSACLTITNTNNGTINETVTTDETLPSPSRPSGSYTLDFIVQVYTAAGCGTGTPINLQVDATLTVIAGSASTVAIVRGAGQFTTHSTAFTSPLTAVVLDADGNPVSGVLVTFAAPSSGASGVFAACTSNPNSYTCVATTNAEGVATASTFTANATIGNYYVQVTTAPTTSPSPLNFAEDNT